MKLGYKLFETGSLVKPREYQEHAYNILKSTGKLSNRFELYGYNFILQRCIKFQDLYLLIRQDKTLSGILGPKDALESVQVLGENRVTVGQVTDDRHPEEIAVDTIAEYMGGIVEIKCGETIYRDSNTGNIVIGWHGSYSPPHGME